MGSQRIIVLDGTPSGVDDLNLAREVLLAELRKSGHEVSAIELRAEKSAHCTGCFQCWLKTPGICRFADRGREIVEAMVQSDTVVLFTPITFGGYSSTLKKLVDRWLQCALPFFTKRQGDTHHPKRYPRFPRLLALGVQREPNAGEATIFKILVGRNALNFDPPSFASEVVTVGDSGGVMAEKIRALIVRDETPPLARHLTRLVPLPSPVLEEAAQPTSGRALIIVGSPKVEKPSTSDVLGGYLAGRLTERGWTCETIKLTPTLRSDTFRTRLLAGVDAADLVVLAFPLYIDALPYLVTLALEIIDEHRKVHPSTNRCRLAVLVNNGFPEAHQNIPALAICGAFAARSGLVWAGGLAMGAGEALCSGVPLTERAPGPRPPVAHVMRALDRAAEALAAGHPIPAQAGSEIAKSPIPMLPAMFWRSLFYWMGASHWVQEAKGNGVSKHGMRARPFLPTA